MHADSHGKHFSQLRRSFTIAAPSPLSFHSESIDYWCTFLHSHSLNSCACCVRDFGFRIFNVFPIVFFCCRIHCLFSLFSIHGSHKSNALNATSVEIFHVLTMPHMCAIVCVCGCADGLRPIEILEFSIECECGWWVFFLLDLEQLPSQRPGINTVRYERHLMVFPFNDTLHFVQPSNRQTTNESDRPFSRFHCGFKWIISCWFSTIGQHTNPQPKKKSASMYLEWSMNMHSDVRICARLVTQA